MAKQKPLSKIAIKALRGAASAYQGRELGTNMLNLGRYYTTLLEQGLIEHRGYPQTDVYATAKGREVLRASE